MFDEVVVVPVGSEIDIVGGHTVGVLEETHGVTETDNVTGAIGIGDECFMMMKK